MADLNISGDIQISPTSLTGSLHPTTINLSGDLDTGNGKDGYSPTVDVEVITGGHRITITDRDGAHTFDVVDGTVGVGISDISKTSTHDNEDTYTITYTDGSTTTFVVTNGEVTWNDVGNIAVVSHTQPSSSHNVIWIEDDGTTIELPTMEEFEEVADDVSDLKADINQLEDALNVKEGARYGVIGIGQKSANLSRLWDAAGMRAQVGTDGDNSSVVNDFDHALPFMRRKCVGYWSAENGEAVFHVTAYEGEVGYAEDGSAGDYVAVECPKCYYYFKDGILGVSAHKYDGWRAFDIFLHDHDPNQEIDRYYRPAYDLCLDNAGHAVCLPGYYNAQGSYRSLMDAARTYRDGNLDTLPFLYPMALSFYEWALFTVEFATQNCQSIMYGCGALRSNAQDIVTFFGDSTHALINNWRRDRVVGMYVAIVATNRDIHHVSDLATHKITALTRVDASGNPSSSGTYTLMELEDLGRGYYEYDTTGATEYHIGGRPYITGACNGVSTPSGSPVSNTNGYYPMKYRHAENIYGNQYKTTADLFDMRVGTGDDDYRLEYYYLLRPQDYAPSTSSKPDAADLATDKFVKIGVETAHENYVNGYIKSKKYDEDYPDIWIPFETVGGSASTYFADYAYLVTSSAVRSVRLFGAWYSGSSDGLSFFYGNTAPSSSYAYYGGSLCFPQ